MWKESGENYAFFVHAVREKIEEGDRNPKLVQDLENAYKAIILGYAYGESKRPDDQKIVSKEHIKKEYGVKDNDEIVDDADLFDHAWVIAQQRIAEFEKGQ